MKLPNHQQTLMTTMAQEVMIDNGITVAKDGTYGPRTSEALDRYCWRLTLTANLPLDPECCIPTPPAIAALLCAERQVGRGGAPGKNNTGSYLEEMRASLGYNPNDDGSWCAIFASDAFQWADIDIKSKGAKDIVRQAAKRPGYQTIQLRKVQPGDFGIASWDRGTEAWQGHVRFWLYIGDGIFLTIGGNEDPGDRVHCRNMTTLQFSKKLVQVVRMGHA